MTHNLTLTALGGLGETGSLNCMLYQTPEVAFLVDAGLGFPSQDMPGVNLLIPDFSTLEPLRHKLKALVLTHGHEDHVGAVVALTKAYNLPIYATPFTQGIVRHKFKEAGLKDFKIMDLPLNQTLVLGDFSIEPVFVNHSILDTVGLWIKTKEFNLMHLTDFKIDHGAPLGKVTDLQRMDEIGNQGLDLLLMDSTNSLSPGWTASEKLVGENLLKQIQPLTERVLICLFSSNIIRLQSIIDVARQTGRKIALTGRSSKDYVAIAKSISKLNTEGVEFLDVEETATLPDSEVLLVVTGSQAEPRSVLKRISEDFFKPFKIRHGDVVLMSSKMIPGNETRVMDMISQLTKNGARVVFDDETLPIHASGHAQKDELLEIFKRLKPKYFIPIHGEYLQLKRHIECAAEAGVPLKNSRLTLNGEVVSLSSEGLMGVDLWPVSKIHLTDNKLVIEAEAIRLRRKMALNGLVALSVVLGQKRGAGLLIQIESYGLIGQDREQKACVELAKILDQDLSKQDQTDLEALKKRIKIEARKYFRDQFFMRPEVIIFIHEV